MCLTHLKHSMYTGKFAFVKHKIKNRRKCLKVSSEAQINEGCLSPFARDSVDTVFASTQSITNDDVVKIKTAENVIGPRYINLIAFVS